MEESTSKKKGSRTVFIVQTALNIVLFILLGFFTYNYFSTDKKLAFTEEKLYSTESAKTELEKILKQTEVDLEQYKGKNSELDQFLREKNDSLQEFAERIEALVRQGKVSRDKLNQTLDELDQLRYYKRKYLGQIDSLSTVITVLNKENLSLKSDITKQKRKNEDLTMENLRLNTKVAIGAKLNAQNLFVTGIKIRSNGKEKETIRVAQIEQLKVTFSIDENYVSEKGHKDIYLKVTGVDGNTMYNEKAGSGVFKYQNEESLYSSKKTIDFDQTAQPVSIYWNRGSEFAPGKYTAELFCEGFKIGETLFELK